MPKGVSVASGLKSWSAASVPVRLLPRRENGPTATVALASSESRRVSGASSAWGLTSLSRSKMASVWGTFFGAALGHLGEPVAEHVELRVDRLLGGQFLVGVPLAVDQPAADLGGADADEEPVGLELRVGLALAVDDVPDVVEEPGEVLLSGLAAAAVEGVDTGHAGFEFVHPLADRVSAPAEVLQGPALPAPPRPIALTVLAMKSRFRLPRRASAALIRTGIISGWGRICVAPMPLGAKTTGYGRLFFFQAPKKRNDTLPRREAA